jgi:hypothetical protein
MSSLAFLLDCSFTLIYKPASLQHVTWRDSHTTFARNITWRSASGLLSLAQSCVDNYRPILRMRLGLVAASRHLGGSPVPVLSCSASGFTMSTPPFPKPSQNLSSPRLVPVWVLGFTVAVLLTPFPLATLPPFLPSP